MIDFSPRGFFIIISQDGRKTQNNFLPLPFGASPPRPGIRHREAGMKKIRIASLTLALLLLCGPLFSTRAFAIPDMEVAAKSALLADADTGQILFAQNADEQVYPASVTKVMTALLVMEAIDSGKLKTTDVITVQSSAHEDTAEDGSTQNLKAGEQLTVQELLECMLIASANEACNILAEEVAGSISSFVDQMNARAQELGCTNTHFVNAHGLPDPQHYTSAHDMYLITAAAMKYPLFLEITNSQEATIPATNLSPERHFFTTNYLISRYKIPGYVYQYAQGIKTGHTAEAGYCLVSSAAKNKMHLVSVVFGAEKVTKPDGTVDYQSFSETKRLFEWAFDNFASKTYLDASEPVQEVPVTLSSDADYVVVHPKDSLSALLPKDVDLSKFERKVTIYSDGQAQAPIAEGQELGEITLSYNGQVYGTTKLVALNSLSRSPVRYIVHEVKAFFSNPLVKIGIVVILILIVVGIILISRRGRKGRYAGRRSSGGSYGGSYRGGRRRR